MYNYLMDIHFSNLNDKISIVFLQMLDSYTYLYIELLKKLPNTLLKQRLLKIDMRTLLNLACSYSKFASKKSINLINIYAEEFPFLLNEYEIFEYYAIVLGVLSSSSMEKFDFFIKEVEIENKNMLELPSEEETKDQVYKQLTKIFESGIQKSHIINNNNIAFNLANFASKSSFNSIVIKDEAKNFSLNILQKVYNNIKKIEISSFLKTTAYLDPKNFEKYLQDNVYKYFDKYYSISEITDLHNFSDYAKSSVLQIRNKYLGIVEGKINSLLQIYKEDHFYEQITYLKFEENNSIKNTLFDYIYYQILRDYFSRIDYFIDKSKTINELNEKKLLAMSVSKIEKRKEISIDVNGKIIKNYENEQNIPNEKNEENNSLDIYSLLIELTSFLVYIENNKFETSFNKKIIIDETLKIISSVPIFLFSTKSIECGTFCWEWILYFNNSQLLDSLLANIILSFKSYKDYSYNNFYLMKTSKHENKIFTAENEIKDKKKYLLDLFFMSTGLEIKKTPKIKEYVSDKYCKPFKKTSNIQKTSNLMNSTKNFKADSPVKRSSITNMKPSYPIFNFTQKEQKENFQDDIQQQNKKDLIPSIIPLNLVRILDEELYVKNNLTNLEDFILSQINFLKFIKECFNEICKTDIQKLNHIFELMKIFVDLEIEVQVFTKTNYIYLHFLVISISLELINILEDRTKLISISKKSIFNFRINLYLFAFKYF